MEIEQSLTIKERIILFWGKARRFYYHALRPDVISKSHRRRRGECARCGVCCHIGAKCPHYGADGDGLSLCERHSIRPRNCRVFPIDERDIADRDILAPDVPCGYHFVCEAEPVRDEKAPAEAPALAAGDREISAE